MRLFNPIMGSYSMYIMRGRGAHKFAVSHLSASVKGKIMKFMNFNDEITKSCLDDVISMQKM